MLSVKNLIFGALAISASVSASVIKRDAASIQNSLETIDSDLRQLTSQVNGYNGGLFAALPIQSSESQLEDDIDAATSTAQASNPLSASDSQAIIAYINDTLEPDIEATLDALVAKKSQFQRAGLAGTVRGDLNTLRGKTNDLGDALIDKAAAETKASGQAALDTIDGDFAEAVAAYA
ncbi:hypothetical protein MBLNU230_g7751t1 [Neophaeotheca triangularis]